MFYSWNFLLVFRMRCPVCQSNCCRRVKRSFLCILSYGLNVTIARNAMLVFYHIWMSHLEKKILIIFCILNYFTVISYFYKAIGILFLFLIIYFFKQSRKDYIEWFESSLLLFLKRFFQLHTLTYGTDGAKP